MAEVLDDEILYFFSSEEIAKIEKPIVKKIQEAWSLKTIEVDQLKIEVEKCKTDYGK